MTKDAEERVRTAHDVKLQLLGIAEGGSQAGVPAPVAAAASRRGSRERLAWMVAAAALIAAAGLAWRVLGARGPEPEAIQSLVDAPPDVTISGRASESILAPDGRTIVFVTSGALWVRPLGSETATAVPGAEPAMLPFWSPDSRTIAYFDFKNRKLMKVPAAGGSPALVCAAPNVRGGSWSRNGTIVFAPASSGPLMQVAATGGDPVAVTTLDSTRHENGHRFPCFLPDGEHFLFTALPEGPAGYETYVGSLRSRTVKHLLTARSAVVYAEPGYVLFERDGHVMAQRFDSRGLELQGAASTIATAPEPSDMDAEPVASASWNGRLAILRSMPPDTRLEMLDRTGTTTARYELPPGPWTASSVSPDGRRAAVLKGNDFWIVDLVRSVPMRFATTTSNSRTSVWSPDGNRIAFVSTHNGRDEIFIAGLDGRADPVPTTDAVFKYVTDWSTDGRYIVFWGVNPETGFDIWLLPMDGDRKPVPYLRGTAHERAGRISPDGRWMAYMSNETGQEEIYVQSFPEPGRKVRVSVDGGSFPRWAEGGTQLYYNNANARIAVPVQAGEEFQPGSPSKLFTFPDNVTGAARVGDEGNTLVSVATRQSQRDIRLILDWTALLGR